MLQIISLLLLMVNSLPGSSGASIVGGSDEYNPLKKTGSKLEGSSRREIGPPGCTFEEQRTIRPMKDSWAPPQCREIDGRTIRPWGSGRRNNDNSIDEEELSNGRKLSLEDEIKDDDARKQYIIPPRYPYLPLHPYPSWSHPLRSPYLRKMTIDGDTEKTDNGRKQARIFPGYPFFPPYPYPNPANSYHWVERH